MTVTVFIRYQIDPFKRHLFEDYAKRWLTIIPKCGGDVVGYWMPHEGTNNIAFGLISFGSLADYESYRARVRGDGELQLRRSEPADPRGGADVSAGSGEMKRSSPLVVPAQAGDPYTARPRRAPDAAQRVSGALLIRGRSIL